MLQRIDKNTIHTKKNTNDVFFYPNERLGENRKNNLDNEIYTFTKFRIKIIYFL